MAQPSVYIINSQCFLVSTVLCNERRPWVFFCIKTDSNRVAHSSFTSFCPQALRRTFTLKGKKAALKKDQKKQILRFNSFSISPQILRKRSKICTKLVNIKSKLLYFRVSKSLINWRRSVSKNWHTLLYCTRLGWARKENVLRTNLNLLISGPAPWQEQLIKF